MIIYYFITCFHISEISSQVLILLFEMNKTEEIAEEKTHTVREHNDRLHNEAR